jgi:UDP-N-acetylglucosamine--N-acetylmuramyl-(pentapeptide) pyrophosphoryl-undecaprenol N-acetylglucosamine transferase
MINASGTTVMIMAGGTGGHVFPALAVAARLRDAGARLAWIGTARGIENRLVPEANIRLHLLRVEGVRGKGLLGLIKAPFLIALAVLQALAIMRREQPDVVIGFGGFASGPGGVAARMLRKPLVIHEQNAVAGTTNRLLARIATRVLMAFPAALPAAVVVGNPVRAAIANLASPTVRYRARMAQQTRLNVLVLGGSLGAQAINTLVPGVVAKLSLAERPKIWHQTGGAHCAATQAHYQQHNINDAKVEAFIDDMAAAYAWADIVICRAGALTVSEIMAAGVAAIFIPLPTAIDDHQTRNADILVKAGAALSFAQRELDASVLAERLLTFNADRELLVTMAEKARQQALPCAADQVAQYCVEAVGE